MIMKFTILFTFLFTGICHSGTSDWTIVQSPITDTFNGISAANNYFAIGVGKNGKIVHFVNGDAGTEVPSGTTNELFDVYAASENLAVASGRNIVLLWDGMTWSKIAEPNPNIPELFYTGGWITPERDVVFFQSLGFFNFIFPHLPGVPLDQQPFGRAFSKPMLTACGKSNDIKFFTSDGDIHHLNNNLGEISGTSEEPLHNEELDLSFTAIYVPKTSCLPFGIKPINVYAIRNTDEFWKFDGETWSNMNVNVPANQTISWLSGISSSQIYAVGFKPDGNGGNSGVIWNYDGITWSEETNLPSGLLGLTDITASLGRIDAIFSSGFENQANRTEPDDIKIDILAAAEAGTMIDLGEVLPKSIIDLSVQKDLITPEPIKVNDTITFKLEIKNIGNIAAVDVRFIDGYINNIQHLSNDCDMTFYDTNADENSTFIRKTIPLLGIGEKLVCHVQFKVIGPAGQTITNVAMAKEEEYQFDGVFANNSRRVTNITIQPE